MRLIFIHIILLISASAYSQGYMRTSYLHGTKSLYNVANIGVEGDFIFHLGSRTQWMEFEGAPRSIIGHFEKRLDSDPRIAFGVSLNGDMIGVTDTRSGNFAMSYKIPLDGAQMLSMGFGFSINQFTYNRSQLDPVWTEPLMEMDDYSKTLPNFSFGILMASKKYYVGLSAPQLLTTKLHLDTSQIMALNFRSMHIYISGGFEGGDEKKGFSPNFILKYVPNMPVQLDFNIEYIKYYAYRFGVGFSTGHDMLFHLGYDVGTTMKIRYTYGLPVFDHFGFSPSHQFSITGSLAEKGFSHAIGNRWLRLRK